jgi:hypothetical protein
MILQRVWVWVGDKAPIDTLTTSPSSQLKADADSKHCRPIFTNTQDLSKKLFKDAQFCPQNTEM